MLVGAELLAKIKELGEISKSDVVRACGYTTAKKDGTERLNFTAFYNAVLEAKGISVGIDEKASGRGRKLSYETRIQFNGNLMVGKAYTAQLGLEPGDLFEIRLVGPDEIKLLRIATDEAADDGTTEDKDEALTPFTDELDDAELEPEPAFVA